MSTKIDYTPLGGGLDLVSGALNVKPGRLAECLNFEQVFGRQGYRRIEGYERYDGRLEPHKARYSMVPFDQGSAAIAAGAAITGATASAKVLQVNVTSGAWAGGSAAGELVVLMVAGAFANGEAIKMDAATAAMVSGPVANGSMSQAFDDAYTQLAVRARRDAILPVPGSGPVLGVAVYKGDVLAARNAADGLTAALYRSNPMGWVLVKGGLLPGGAFQFEVANFSGSTKSIFLFGVDGRNRPFRWDGVTFTRMGAIQGSQGASVTSNAIGVGAKTFTVTEPARSWTPGQDVLIYSAANAANRMAGTVSTYAGGVLAVAVVSTGGSGTFTDWMIGLEGHADEPYLLAEHRDHLFLAYPNGQLQTSNLGEPMAYTATAALFGLGDEITGMTSMRGSVLGVFCANNVYLLSGASSLDWSRERYSKSAGAKRGTVQETGGNALFLDGRGLTSLQATQNYGDFEPAIFSRDIKPLLDSYTRSMVASRIAKGKFQYRMYAADKTRITAAILSPNAVVQPSDVAFTVQQYAHAVACVGEGDMADGIEGMFFGTAEGYVMREDVGTSFDGAAISAVMRLHFNHLKSPSNKKRFRKLDIELETGKSLALYFRLQFDYEDGTYAASPTRSALAQGGGGRWDSSAWDEFLWSMPVVSQAEAHIDGVGRNMGLLIWHESASDAPFSMHGLLLQYAVLGLSR